MINLATVVAGLSIGSVDHGVLHSPVCGCSGCLIPQSAAFLIPAAARAANLPSNNGASGKEKREL